MEQVKKLALIFIGLLIFPVLSLNGQVTESTSPVNVFLDANEIDDDYIREEFTLVNYVRTKEVANVHLLGTRQSTGAGFHYQFFFIGSKEFEGKNDTLSYYSTPQSTEAEVKEGYTKAVRAGLMHYMALANFYPDYKLEVAESQRGGSTVEADPWNSWVFEIGVDGNLGGEDSRKTEQFASELNITKVTPEWRYEFRFDYETEKKIFEYDDYFSESSTLEGGLRYWVVKSLGDHAGIGLLGEVQSNTVDNYDFNNIAALAIEYNLFPYDMSSRRQLYLSYFAGVDYRNYIDTTIFDKLFETLPFEKVQLGYSQKEQWGNVYTTLSFQHFFRDFNENNLSLDAGMSIRIWKGLSWEFNVSYSLINDDINISKEELDPEDIILGLRQLSTSSSYDISTGISFTFGSMYNNVVNTRLKHSSGNYYD